MLHRVKGIGNLLGLELGFLMVLLLRLPLIFKITILQKKINALKSIDNDNVELLVDIGSKIRQWITQAEMPPTWVVEIT
jgi:hypothetical protein